MGHHNIRLAEGQGATVAKTSRVLWIDDGSGAISPELGLLALGGFQVDVADGERALVLCAGGHYDVALLDSRTAGADSVATLRRLRRAAPALRTILIAGYERTEMVRQAMREGVEAVFQRPAEAACFLPLLLT